MARKHGRTPLNAPLAVPIWLCVDNDPPPPPPPGQLPVQDSPNTPDLHTAPCEVVAKSRPRLHQCTELLGGGTGATGPHVASGVRGLGRMETVPSAPGKEVTKVHGG